MMYNSKLVATIKVNGKVLREFGDIVYIPFGSEYSIFIKNMDSVRAEVGISIDGSDVLGGEKLVVYGNSSLDIERFLENNNRGHRFKYIKRTGNIERNRGVGIEDGLIRIEYKFEKRYPKYVPDVLYYRATNFPSQYPIHYGDLRGTYGISGDSQFISSKGVVSGSFLNAVATGSSSVGSASIPVMTMTSNAVSDPGITTKGEISNQKFQNVASFPTEDQTHVMIIQLKGENQGSVIKKAVDVSRKQKCECCGRVNKATSHFCQECGTSLVVLA